MHIVYTLCFKSILFFRPRLDIFIFCYRFSSENIVRIVTELKITYGIFVLLT